MYLILDQSLKVCGSLSLEGKGCKFYNDIRTVQIMDDTGTKLWNDTLTLSVPYGYEQTDMMTEGYHLLKQGDDGYWYCFRISTWEDDAIGNTHVKVVQATNLCIWDLAHTNVVPATLMNAISTDAFNHCLQNSGWEVGTDNFAGGGNDETFNVGDSAQTMIQTLTQDYGVEIRAYVEVTNGQVTGKKIDIESQLGEVTGRRIEYAHNILNISRQGSDSQLFTKIKVYGGTPDNATDPISIAPVNDGKDFIVHDDANDLYNNGSDKYLEGYTENTDITDPGGLLTWGQQQLALYNHPKYTYTVDVAALDWIPNLGDTVDVLDFEMTPALTVSARVIQKMESESDVTANQVILGEFVEIPVVTPSDIQSLSQQITTSTEAAKSYTLEYLTPDGLDFSDDSSLKRIIVRVFKGKNDITSTIDPTFYLWKKINPDGSYDTDWETTNAGIGNVLLVGSEVVGCIIRCTLDDGNLPTLAIYFSNGIDTVVNELKSIQTDSTLSVLFITDTHFATGSTNGNNLKSRSTLHLENASYLTNKVKIDVTVHGGDLVDGYEPKNMQMTDFADAAASLHNYIQTPLLFLKGNHDDNSWYAHDNDGNLMQSVLQPAEMYSIYSQYMDTNIVQDTGNEDLMYYYKDFSNQKIRIIVLNSFDNPYITQTDGTNEYPSQYTMAFGNSQLNWLANTALLLPDNTWGVLIFTHGPLQGTFSSQAQINSDLMYGILSAFTGGTTYMGSGTTTDYEATVSCDFTSQGVGEVMAVISGHIHYDSSMTKNGMLLIQTLDSLARNDFAGDMPDRPLSTLQEDAWDVFTIDRTSRTIYATRFGAGSDRQFSY